MIAFQTLVSLYWFLVESQRHDLMNRRLKHYKVMEIVETNAKVSFNYL
jgi:flavin-binding protein dodecin